MSLHLKKWAWLGLSTDSVGDFVIILSNVTDSAVYVKWIKNDQSVTTTRTGRLRLGLYSPAMPFLAMPQVDGCAGQMNGLPFLPSTSRFSRRENMGVAVAGRTAFFRIWIGLSAFSVG
jgi:hypothetical protein